MLDVGRKFFAKIHKQKRHANPNHDVHFMAREMDNWLVQGVESMADGSYTPRHLKRHYFTDEMVDQLHLSDRIFQNILLKQLKPTFPHVMNPNCYHLHGPSGVRLATQDQNLFASMDYVVGKNVTTLAVSRTIRMVFTGLLGF